MRSIMAAFFYMFALNKHLMKTNRFWSIFLVLFSISTLFTSCFETIEEININSDGSGTMVLTLNMSQSKTKVASLMKMKSVNGHKIPTQSEIRNEMNASAAALRAIKGISNVKTSLDFDNYIAVCKFDFNDAALLNVALQKIMSNYKVSDYNSVRYYYNKSKKTFTKAYMANNKTTQAYNNLKQDEKDVFRNATYTSIYRFATRVQSMTNKKSIISKSGTAVMHKAPILGVIHATTNISNSITLK